MLPLQMLLKCVPTGCWGEKINYAKLTFLSFVVCYNVISHQTQIIALTSDLIDKPLSLPWLPF